MKAVETIENAKPIEDVEELKQDESSSNKDNLIVEGIFRCILSFITTFFNLMTTIFKRSPGILWGIIFVFALQIAMSHLTNGAIIGIILVFALQIAMSHLTNGSTFQCSN